jgi:hypothetical protein
MLNSSRTISNFFLSISLLFFFYVIYRSEIHHNGSEFGFYLKFYILAFLLIFISFITYFIPKIIKINLLVFSISILLGLYISEAFLSFKNKKFSIYKNLTGLDYDQRTKFEIYSDLKEEDPNIVVSPPPVHFKDGLNFNYAPLSGIANSRTIHCNENGYFSIYQSDRYGFNNPDKEWDKMEIDYLLVGDSMVRGACVNEPNTFSGNLKKLTNNKNGILNLGQTGNGPLRQYATLREYLPHKNVKRVIWFYSEGNDLKELSEEINHQILLQYLKNQNFSQDLILKNSEIQKLLLSELSIVEKILKKNSLFEKKNKRNYLIDFLILKKIRIHFVESFLNKHKEKNYIFMKKDFENIINLSKQLIKDNNSRFYFVYLPLYTRFQLNKNEDNNFKNYNEIIQIVEDLDIPLIDIKKELFDNIKDPLKLFPFGAAGHYNAKGFDLVSKKIYDKINQLEK